MGKRLKIASWNINSVRARPALVERLIAEHQPDILCLQETKANNDVFPAELFTRFGYRLYKRSYKKDHKLYRLPVL